MKKQKIQEKIEVNVSKSNIRKLFEYFVKNPDEYEFNTHKGIEIGKKPIDKIGATFHTRERFGPLKLRLKFQTFEYDPQVGLFSFRLLRPLKKLNIRGVFQVKSITNTTKKALLILSVISPFADSIVAKVFRFIIFVTPVSFIIKSQLKRELLFIRNFAENQLNFD